MSLAEEPQVVRVRRRTVLSEGLDVIDLDPLAIRVVLEESLLDKKTVHAFGDIFRMASDC